MKSSRRGVSLIELLIVLAIGGIVLAVGAVNLNSNGAATRQAAQVVAAKINQARFEAVRTNNTAGIVFVADDGTQSGLIRICRNVDETTTLSCTQAAAYDTVGFTGTELGRTRIASPATLAVYFDRRGIVRTGSTIGAITITDRSGNNVRTVTILPTGRAAVE